MIDRWELIFRVFVQFCRRISQQKSIPLWRQWGDLRDGVFVKVWPSRWWDIFNTWQNGAEHKVAKDAAARWCLSQTWVFLPAACGWRRWSGCLRTCLPDSPSSRQRRLSCIKDHQSLLQEACLWHMVQWLSQGSPCGFSPLLSRAVRHKLPGLPQSCSMTDRVLSTMETSKRPLLMLRKQLVTRIWRVEDFCPGRAFRRIRGCGANPVPRSLGFHVSTQNYEVLWCLMFVF